MLHVHADIQGVIAPMRATLDPLLRDMDVDSLHVVPADLPRGFWSFDDNALLLDRGLCGPSIRHPNERSDDLGLDRWRRTASCVLEACVLRQLGLVQQANDWRALGLAIHRADALAPELRLSLPDLANAAEGHDLGREPRGGVAVIRAIIATAQDPERLVLDPSTALFHPTPEQWLQWGRFVLGSGLASQLPIAIQSVQPRDVPLHLDPWSWVRVDVPAHPRGGRITTAGDAVIDNPWARGGRRHNALAGSLARSGDLGTDVGGPVGTWTCTSANGWGQVFGVRGITYNFKGSGALEFVLADAFAGPLEALEVAERIGTSGVVPGRWSVDGDHTVRFSGMSTASLSMHGRDADPFIVPAAGLGMSTMLKAMQDGTWRWHISGSELTLTGTLMGGPIDIRLRRATR
ncbi:MAG: hypothetical protein ACI9MC_000104 [Kiritimatiellia bacterium]|jgi:hypothetical protein